jgi:glycerol-3-phosphate dehydrogenase
VNAAGAWAQGVRDMDMPASAAREKLRLVKGSHIVTRRLYAGDHAFLFQNADGRVIFAIPYEGDFTLIGTTDIPVATAEEGERIGAAEIAYLCRAVSDYLAAPVTPGDVVWTFAGVRALADDGDANPSKNSRDDTMLLDAGEDGKAAPMLSVFGGKLTTHRSVAERALARLAPVFPGMGAPWTAHAILPGGDIGGDPEIFANALAGDYAWAPAPMLRRMAGAYGSRARDVLDDARGMRDLGRHFGADLYERELAYMIEHEFARTAEDALWRRSKRGLVLSPDERRAVAERMGA